MKTKTSWRTKILGMSSIILLGAGTTALIHEQRGIEVPAEIMNSAAEFTERVREGIEATTEVVADII